VPGTTGPWLFYLPRGGRSTSPRGEIPLYHTRQLFVKRKMKKFCTKYFPKILLFAQTAAAAWHFAQKILYFAPIFLLAFSLPTHYNNTCKS
jgi:hypothetical protein